MCVHVHCNRLLEEPRTYKHTHKNYPSNLLSLDDECWQWGFLSYTMLPIFSSDGSEILTVISLNFQLIILDSVHSTSRAEDKGQIHSQTCTDTQTWNVHYTSNHPHTHSLKNLLIKEGKALGLACLILPARPKTKRLNQRKCVNLWKSILS